MGTHFSAAGLKFLAALARHNQREWFDPRKHIYEAEVKAPMLDLIGEVNDAFAGFAPEFVRDPKKCMMRIYRDIRFSKNKQPYKTHAAAWWARHGLEKTSGGGFYLEVGPEAVRIAAGAYMPDKEQLLAIRQMLLLRHEEVRRALTRKGMTPLDAMRMTRGPKGFSTEHPAIDLISQRQWGLSTVLPSAAATSPDLVKQIVRRFRLTLPLVALLNEPLLPAARKPLF